MKKLKGHQLKAVEHQGTATRDISLGAFLVYYVNKRKGELVSRNLCRFSVAVDVF